MTHPRITLGCGTDPVEHLDMGGGIVVQGRFYDNERWRAFVLRGSLHVQVDTPLFDWQDVSPMDCRAVLPFKEANQ